MAKGLRMRKFGILLLLDYYHAGLLLIYLGMYALISVLKGKKKFTFAFLVHLSLALKGGQGLRDWHLESNCFYLSVSTPCIRGFFFSFPGVMEQGKFFFFFFFLFLNGQITHEYVICQIRHN